MKTTAEIYAEKILSGKIPSCKLTQEACKRFVNDLQRKEWQFIYDRNIANMVVEIAESLNFYKGNVGGKPVKLEPWQCFILQNVFAWVNKKTYRRRFTKMYIEVARKNGKTTLMAIMIIIEWLIADEQAAEFYTAATKLTQAMEVYNAVRGILRKTPDIGCEFNISQSRLRPFIGKGEDTFTALAYEPDKLDGLNPHVAIIDEYHAHKFSHMADVILSGMGNRENPLFAIITTAGFNKNYPCYKDERLSAVMMLKGEIEMNHYFSLIYTVDDPEKWEDEEEWKKANPNWGISVDAKFMRNQFIEAKRSRSKEANFKTKHLNIWYSNATSWIKAEDWEKCGEDINIQDFKGHECYIGIDLAATKDFCALVYIFPKEDNIYIFPKIYIPESMVFERENFMGSIIREWADNNYITVTPGNVHDYSFIIDELQTSMNEFQIKKVGMDQAFATNLMVDLLDMKLPVESYRQGRLYMSPPSKEFERLILSGNLIHGQNPAMDWMVGNAYIKTDAIGNIQVDKQQSDDKVDGVIATIIGLGVYMNDKLSDAQVPETPAPAVRFIKRG